MAAMQTVIASYSCSTIQRPVSRAYLQASAPRLPCRGCTIDCPDYPQCQGKPWRLAKALSENQIVKLRRPHK